MNDSDDLLRILAENGFDGSGVDPHSWRCSDKGRYPGDCGCATGTVDDLLVWLAEHDAALVAERDARIAAALEILTRDGIWLQREATAIRALNGEVSSALTERDAEKWDEAITFFEDYIYGERTSARDANPYRVTPTEETR